MPEPVIMTAEDLEALQAELHELETTEREAIAERIKTAREWGDLKENGEYHAAKEAQAHLETKILVLSDRMRRAELRSASAARDVVAFGSKVTVRDEKADRDLTYTLVSARDADVGAGRLSYESPVAKALDGRRPGDMVKVRTPRGERSLMIVSIG
ncbi:MAG: transcription elongation factor GreA [Solirubrobacterales bacterium]|nr:transcription elongation factor GreA [Solirubrobacterales bacterium]